MVTNPYKSHKLIGMIFSIIGATSLAAAALIVLLNMQTLRESGINSGAGASALALGIWGAVFFLIGIAFYIYMGFRKRYVRRLMANGEKVLAQIEDIQPNYSATYGRQHPFVVQCAWKNPDDGITYHFRSMLLWINPQKIFEDKKITALPVYIDRQNFRKYYVSLQVLEEGNVFL